MNPADGQGVFFRSCFLPDFVDGLSLQKSRMEKYGLGPGTTG